MIMDLLTNVKLTIFGAAVMIGSNMAHAALSMKLTPNICLYDPYAPALEGVAEEMYHCAFEGVNLTYTSDIAEALTGASYVVSSGGAARKAGMTREDLLKGNAEIAVQLGKDIKQYAPNVAINVSTQANIVSLHAANFWYHNGAKRMIMAREMNKKQLKYIMENKPEGMEIEIFIHGAICFAFSGRCFLSDFMSCRSANLGDCAQSCRWSYNLYAEEKNNPGELMPIETSEYGTSIFSSKDLCLIKEIPEIIEMGVDSLKIEGRLKTEYYLASVIGAYRNAIDDYEKDPEHYDYTKYLKELEKVKTRGLTTFYFNDRNNKDIQEYGGRQYNEKYEFGGKVVEYNEEKSVIEIKNKLQVGDKMEILIPYKLEPVQFTIDNLWDYDTKEEIQAVSPGVKGQKVLMKLPMKCEKDWIIRREKI